MNRIQNTDAGQTTDNREPQTPFEGMVLRKYDSKTLTALQELKVEMPDVDNETYLLELAHARVSDIDFEALAKEANEPLGV